MPLKGTATEALGVVAIALQAFGSGSGTGARKWAALPKSRRHGRRLRCAATGRALVTIPLTAVAPNLNTSRRE
jgi:hypothetical protein